MSASPKTSTGFFAAIWSVMRTPISPKHRGWRTLGWPLLLLFVLQVATGILLSFYYQPSPAEAADSTRRIMRDVDWGWLVRGVHHWSAQGIIVLTVLQLLRALLGGSWHGERASSWHLGLMLIPLVFLLAFTGELLKWDAVAYWTVSRSLDALAAMPMVGPGLATLVRGGDEISATTLSRIHSAHTQFLPWLVFVLVTLNLVFLARRRRQAKEGSR